MLFFQGVLSVRNTQLRARARAQLVGLWARAGPAGRTRGPAGPGPALVALVYIGLHWFALICIGVHVLLFLHWVALVSTLVVALF